MAVKREDLSCLEKFDEDSVLEVLRSRYANDEIYVSTDKKVIIQCCWCRMYTEPKSNMRKFSSNQNLSTIMSLMIYNKITLPYSRTGTRMSMHFLMFYPWLT